jgi:hypothetical protein
MSGASALAGVTDGIVARLMIDDETAVLYLLFVVHFSLGERKMNNRIFSKYLAAAGKKRL